MLLIRKIHAYIGFLIAPSVLFFAFSGCLQLFSLHESHGGYHAPTVLVTLGNLHKDQVLEKPHHDRPKPAEAAKAEAAKADQAPAPGKANDEDKGPAVKTYVLKWVFALVAAGLFTSTGLGLYIGLRFTRTPRLSWGLLLLGVAIPILVLLL